MEPVLHVQTDELNVEDAWFVVHGNDRSDALALA